MGLDGAPNATEIEARSPMMTRPALLTVILMPPSNLLTRALQDSGNADSTPLSPCWVKFINDVCHCYYCIIIPDKCLNDLPAHAV